MDIEVKANQRLAELGLDGVIYKSHLKGKKLMLVREGEKTIHFGQDGSITYLEGASNDKRKNYRARASKIKNKNKEYTYNIPYTANYLSYNILW